MSPFPPFAPFKPPSDAPFAPPFSIPAVFAQNFRLGVTESWNLSIEHQFAYNIVVRGAYVGSQSYHQSDIIDQNPGICGPVVGGSCSTGGPDHLHEFLQYSRQFQQRDGQL